MDPIILSAEDFDELERVLAAPPEPATPAMIRAMSAATRILGETY
jgi:hypothetical protein